MKKEIYLDHAATTKMWPEVKAAMEPYLTDKYGNASTTYDIGKESGRAMQNARETIAALMGAKPEEIFFTSGGSESDNWAVKGIAGSQKEKKTHVITSKIEHHAILNSCRYLEQLGYEVTYLDVDGYGMVDMKELKDAVDKNTSLISIMYANNEIGTLEPIYEIGAWAKEQGIVFHTDAVQAVGQLPIRLHGLPVDLLSASAHKFHGPKGVGFLYVREGVTLPSYIHGGAQEHGKRAGTENVAGIVGMEEALRISILKMQENMSKQRRLRDYFVQKVQREIPEVRLNGHPFRRLPGNANLGFSRVNATALLVLLEEEGICASAGSACNTGSNELSHVLKAIGVPKLYADGCIRFTFGAENTKEEADHTIRILKESVDLLRQVY